jgi:hypothetical protein
MRRCLGFDFRDQLRGEMRGQALNDIEKLYEFLLSQCVDLVVKQFYSSSAFTLSSSRVLRVCGQSRIDGSGSS